MATEEEIRIMEIRKHAAECTLRFFSEIRPVKSNNIPFHCHCEDLDFEENKALLEDFRDNNPNYHISTMMEYSTLSGLGNCGEKAAICYCSLYSNPTFISNSSVSLAQFIEYDHGCVVVSDPKLKRGRPLEMKNLGITTMVVDGWTEDWYFPNLDMYTALLNNLAHFPSPFQLVMRQRAKYGTLERVMWPIPL
ncbi:MAG: hypothetical protein KAH18_07755 [Psychromonas sp.]|nr:hypothetical protein [Psychromonas sp.]